LRLLKNKKGQMRVIEAFFAALLLLSCLSFLPTPQPSTTNSEDLASKAQNILVSLDNNGHLATLIDNRDWESIADSIQSALPLMVWFNLTICDANINILNDYPICNGGAISDKITSTEYVCASQNQTFAIYVLQLQLSGAD
jgi:hypothetical protein